MPHTYDRAQSIAAGKRLDVSDQAYTFGFRVPLASSKDALFDAVQWVRLRGGVQDETERFADVLSLGVAKVKAPVIPNASTRHYTVYRSLVR